jgi:hypothetical protein
MASSIFNAMIGVLGTDTLALADRAHGTDETAGGASAEAEALPVGS